MGSKNCTIAALPERPVHSRRGCSVALYADSIAIFRQRSHGLVLYGADRLRRESRSDPQSWIVIKARR